MIRLRRSVLILAVLGLSWPALAATRLNAHQLFEDAEKAIALTGKGIEQSKIDQASRTHRPFLAILKKTAAAVDKARSDLSAKNGDYFMSLSKAREASEELKIAFEKSGIVDATIVEGVRSTLNALEVLQKNFGKEAVRLKKGGALSAKERERLKTLKGSREAIVAKLAALRKKAAQDGKAAQMVVDIDKLISEANSVPAKDVSVSSFVDLMLLVDALEGQWRGLSLYVQPMFKAEWIEIGGQLSSMNASYLEAIESADSGDWAHYESAIDIPAEFDMEVALTDVEVAKHGKFVFDIAADLEQGDAAIGAYQDADEEARAASDESLFLANETGGTDDEYEQEEEEEVEGGEDVSSDGSEEQEGAETEGSE